MYLEELYTRNNINFTQSYPTSLKPVFAHVQKWRYVPKSQDATFMLA